MRNFLTKLKYKADIVFILIHVIFIFTAETEIAQIGFLVIVWLIILQRELKLHIDKSKEQN